MKELNHKASLTSYIPIDRRLALAAGQKLPLTCEGTVLFADLAGFTSFTRLLTENYGIQRGADELSRCLNLIYGAIIKEIYSYKGSVISFAGDAIMCWFDKDDGERALAAGSGIQKAMARVMSENGLPLQIKLVVNKGPAYRFTVGDPTIQVMDILAGKTVADVNFAEKMADPGEFLASQTILESYRSKISVKRSLFTENGTGYVSIQNFHNTIKPDPWEEPGLIPSDEINMWILDEVYEKIKDSHEGFLAESRIVVNLFIKFDGLNYDIDPESAEKMNSFISWIQKCLKRYEGNLLQVIIGDKGDYIFIGFGALSAHDDDPARAMAAANILLQPPKKMSYISNLRIGISIGRMYTGPYGSNARRTYSMLGADANIAARLMLTAKPGEILVTDRLANSVKDLYEFNPLGLKTIKGFEKPIPIYALVGKQQARENVPQYQTPLIGRAQEFDLIANYASGQDNLNRIVLLEGEGGLGKSRLLSELEIKLQDEDIVLIRSTGNAIEKSTPYYVFRKVFDQFFTASRNEKVSTKETIRDLIAETNPEWVKWLPLLNIVLPLRFRENEVTDQMDGDVKARNLHIILVALLNRLYPNKEYVIILDDSHWIDEASWSLINEITDQTAIRFIISYRPFQSELPEDLTKLKDMNTCLGITLENFDRSTARELIASLIGVDHISDDVLGIIYDKTSGQPFYSEELVYSLLSSGILKIEKNSCEINRSIDLGSVDLPDSIQTAITSRLDRISRPEQLSLKVASIIGRTFGIKALQGIHPSDPGFDELCQQLEELTRINLTSLFAGEPNLAYAFSQNITYEVAYNLLSHRQRQELHAKIALWYEKEYATELHRRYSRLGYHWLHSGDYEKAAAYMENAAYDAASKGAYRDCITFINETLSLEAHLRLGKNRKVNLLAELGMAHFKIGELENATEQLIIAAKAYNKPVPTKNFSLILNLLRQTGVQFYYRIRPKREINIKEEKRALKLKISQAYEYLAQSYYHSNKLFYSFNSALTGVNLAESAGPSAQLARGYGSLCINTSTMAIPGLAEMYSKRAKELLSDDIPLQDHGRVLELLAVAWSGRGKWHEVEALCRQALEMAEQVGDRFLLMETICILSSCVLPPGNFHESLQLREKFLTIGKEDKVPLFQGWALLQLAELALMRNDDKKALDYLSQTKTIQHAFGQTDQVWFYGLMAKVYMDLDQKDAALGSARKAYEISQLSMPTSYFVLEGYSGMIHTFMQHYVEQSKSKKSRKELKKAIRSFAQFTRAFPIGKPRLLFYSGKYAALHNKKEKAIGQWQSGLECANELNMIFEKARMHRILGQNLDHKEEAKNHLEANIKIMSRIQTEQT